jgi:hypothetical protein
MKPIVKPKMPRKYRKNPFGIDIPKWAYVVGIGGAVAYFLVKKSGEAVQAVVDNQQQAMNK